MKERCGFEDAVFSENGLSKMGPAVRRIVQLRKGLTGLPPMSALEVADMLGVTRQRVYQAHVAAARYAWPPLAEVESRTAAAVGAAYVLLHILESEAA